MEKTVIYLLDVYKIDINMRTVVEEHKLTNVP